MFHHDGLSPSSVADTNASRNIGEGTVGHDPAVRLISHEQVEKQLDEALRPVNFKEWLAEALDAIRRLMRLRNVNE